MFMCSKVAGLIFAGAIALGGQETPLDPHSSIQINFPPDSPVLQLSTNVDESRATPRGGAMVVDLHMSLSLRNSGSRNIRGITLLVTAQEVTPGGKASVAVPSLDVAPGQTFSGSDRPAAVAAAASRWRAAGESQPGWRALRWVRFLWTEPPELAPLDDRVGNGSTARPAAFQIHTGRVRSRGVAARDAGFPGPPGRAPADRRARITWGTRGFICWGAGAHGALRFSENAGFAGGGCGWVGRGRRQ